jgi:hypothetical protein
MRKTQNIERPKTGPALPAAPLLLREVRPGEAHLSRQDLVGDLLQRIHHLRRAVAGRRAADDLGRAVEIEAVGVLRPYTRRVETTLES